MRGIFKLKKIDKATGASEVILEESNQVAAGFAAAMVNVLTGTGSRNVGDYSFRYFQLGLNNYNLSSFGVSSDVPLNRLKPNVWTIKNPLDVSAYGRESVFPVVKRDIYGLGSILPHDRTKVFDNFVDPPDTTKVFDDYTNNFQGFVDGQKTLQGDRDSAAPSSIWVDGCSDDWQDARNGVKRILWTSAAPLTASGPNATPLLTSGLYEVDPVYVTRYNEVENVANTTGCIKTLDGYKHTDGTVRKVWNPLQKNQTASVYYMTDYYASSNAAASASTPIGGALQIYNEVAASGAGFKEAGENRVSFMYRYDLKTNSTDDASPDPPEWYPPEILDFGTSSGYHKCFDLVGDCSSNWKSFYGVTTTGGTLSANVHCKDGGMYNGWDASNGYTTRNGPGKDCYTTANSGFGPSGNFYRISVSLNEVPEAVLNVDNGTLSRSNVQIMHYPLLSSLLYVNKTPQGGISDATVGSINNHNVTPREAAYVANFQFEYNPSATPNQYIHGERPYYITKPQYFVQIPYGYTTRLNDDTANVRLLLDEFLANGQTIKEVGLFLKNPSGNSGVDAPFMTSYKIIYPPLEKNKEFSYIIDWELRVADTDSI